MKNDKKARFIMNLMVGITMIVVFLILFFIIKNWNVPKKEPAQQQPQSENEETRNFELEEEDKDFLLDQIKIYDDSFIKYDGAKEPKDLTSEEKLDFVYKLNNMEKTEWNLDWNERVSLVKINSILETYFGPETTLIEPVDYICSIDQLPLLVYDEVLESYSSDLEEHGHGIEAYSKINSYYVEGKKEQEEKQWIYTIKVKKVFSNFSSDYTFSPTIYYKTYTDAMNMQNPVFDLYAIYGENAFIDQDEKIKRQYQKNKDIFPIYTYTFMQSEKEEQPYLIRLEKE